jgi:hypothetical protein
VKCDSEEYKLKAATVEEVTIVCLVAVGVSIGLEICVIFNQAVFAILRRCFRCGKQSRKSKVRPLPETIEEDTSEA